MSGYFSQLAHHTGLSFEPGATKGASNFAAEPKVVVQEPESAPPHPLHVEEISFAAAPAPDTGEGKSERRTTLPDSDRVAAGMPDVRSPEETESKGDDHPEGAQAMAVRSIEFPGESWEESRVALTDSASATRSSGELSAEKSPVRQRSISVPDEPSGAERRSLPVESIAIPYDSIEIVERRAAARDPEAQPRQSPRPEAKGAGRPQPIGDPEPADVVRELHVERETIVRNYLKEIRAWVSAPPELDQRELEWQRDATRPPTAPGAKRSIASHRDVFAPEREVQPATPQPARLESLEVQDLNLSIGTISIVIEEPKQIVPIVAPPPTSMDSSSARAASEPTRLSRYYLERW